jgi:hypothetical protein
MSQHRQQREKKNSSVHVQPAFPFSYSLACLQADNSPRSHARTGYFHLDFLFCCCALLLLLGVVLTTALALDGMAFFFADALGRRRT